METVRSSKVICKMDDLDFGYWDDESETFVSLGTESAAVQKHLKLSDEMLSSLIMFVADIQELIGSDIVEIWERLDYVEKQAFD